MDSDWSGQSKLGASGLLLTRRVHGSCGGAQDDANEILGEHVVVTNGYDRMVSGLAAYLEVLTEREVSWLWSILVGTASKGPRGGVRVLPLSAAPCGYAPQATSLLSAPACVLPLRVPFCSGSSAR